MIERTGSDALIPGGLQFRLEVHAEDLQVSIDQAKLALAYFVESRRTLTLKLVQNGESITWTNRQWVERGKNPSLPLKAASSVVLFEEILGVKEGGCAFGHSVAGNEYQITG